MGKRHYIFQVQRKILLYLRYHRFVCAKGYESRLPDSSLIFHSDRGSNYCSKTLNDYVKSLGLVRSFSRPYVPYDNSVIESFFASMKREELYRKKYRTETDLYQAIDDYIEF